MMAFMSAMQCLSFDFFYPRPPSGLLNVIEAIHKEVKYFLKKHSYFIHFLFNYSTHAIISRGLYISYPIFQWGSLIKSGFKSI